VNRPSVAPPARCCRPRRKRGESDTWGAGERRQNIRCLQRDDGHEGEVCRNRGKSTSGGDGGGRGYSQSLGVDEFFDDVERSGPAFNLCGAGGEMNAHS